MGRGGLVLSQVGWEVLRAGNHPCGSQNGASGRLRELESPAWWSVQEEASGSGLPAAGTHYCSLLCGKVPSLPSARLRVSAVFGENGRGLPAKGSGKSRRLPSAKEEYLCQQIFTWKVMGCRERNPGPPGGVRA